MSSNSPTPWAFDVSYIMYGTLFMMGGAYTLSRDGHVRGDFVYRLWQPRTQAKVELVLYFLFFFPGIIALVFAGWKYAGRSWRYREVSVNSPAGIPIFQFKSVIVAAGMLLLHPGHRPGLPLHPLHPHRRMADGADDDVEETEESADRREAASMARKRSTSSRPRSHATATDGLIDDRSASRPRSCSGSFIFVIFLGFPIAFTLMAMGVGFGYYAYFDPAGCGALRPAGETARTGTWTPGSTGSSTTASSTCSSTRPIRSWRTTC